MTVSERGQQALDLWDAGFNPIPAYVPIAEGKCECRKECKSPGKHPRIQWKTYTHRRPERDEVVTWWQRFPHANIQLMTGLGLAVLDVDPRNKGDESLADLLQKFGPLPATVQAHTGGDGEHYYFLYNEGEEPESVELAPGVEIKARAHAVMAPPSIHSSGKRYEWELSVEPTLDNCAHMPDWFHLARPVNEKGEPQKNPEGWIDEAYKGVEGGARHNTAAKLAGYYLRQGQTNVDCLRNLKLWNQNNRPPLDEDELRDIVKDLAAKETESRNTRQNFSIEKIEKINYAGSPVYYLGIFGVQVRLSADELFQWPAFVRRVGERADRVPQLKDPNKAWKLILDDLLQNHLVVHEPPPESSREENLWYQVAQVLNGRAREDEAALVTQGLYSNEEYYYALPAKLLKILQDRAPGFQRLEPQELWEVLRPRHAQPINKTISGRAGEETMVDAWQIPKVAVAASLPRQAAK